MFKKIDVYRKKIDTSSWEYTHSTNMHKTCSAAVLAIELKAFDPSHGIIKGTLYKVGALTPHKRNQWKDEKYIYTAFFSKD